MRRLLLGSLIAAAALAACQGADSGDSDSGRPSSTGRIRILQPEPGAVLPADQVVVEVGLDGATVVPRATTDIQADEGHIHIKVDGETVTLLGDLEEQVPGLDPGTHLLEVEFAAGDHGSFEPPVIKTVTFTVE